MKKLFFIVSIILLNEMSIFSQTIKWDHINCEKCFENPFTFDKEVVADFETFCLRDAARYNERMNLIIIPNDSANIKTGKLVNLKTISPTEKFILVDQNYRYTLIKNINSSELYVVWNLTWQYSAHGSKYPDGISRIWKQCPKQISINDQEILNKYKSIIKSASAEINILKNIQKKYLNQFGYFLVDKVNAVDRQTYNKTLASLKLKYEKIMELNHLDSNEKIRDQLTTSELAWIASISEWYSNQFSI